MGIYYKVILKYYLTTDKSMHTQQLHNEFRNYILYERKFIFKKCCNYTCRQINQYVSIIPFPTIMNECRTEIYCFHVPTDESIRLYYTMKIQIS